MCWKDPWNSCLCSSPHCAVLQSESRRPPVTFFKASVHFCDLGRLLVSAHFPVGPKTLGDREIVLCFPSLSDCISVPLYDRLFNTDSPLKLFCKFLHINFSPSSFVHFAPRQSFRLFVYCFETRSHVAQAVPRLTYHPPVFALQVP